MVLLENLVEVSKKRESQLVSLKLHAFVIGVERVFLVCKTCSTLCRRNVSASKNMISTYNTTCMCHGCYINLLQIDISLKEVLLIACS